MIKQARRVATLITALFIVNVAHAQTAAPTAVQTAATKTVPTSAQPAVKTGRQPQFENAEVKVWKSVIAPGTPLPLHRHEHPRVLVALTGGTMEAAEENGDINTYRWESGKSYWLAANKPGTRHTDENVGDKPIEVMIIELLKEK